MKTPHGSTADRTVRSFAVPTAGKRLEKCAVGFYKLFDFLLPRNLLFKLCIVFYKSGIFCLKFFDVLSEQVKLSVKKG